MSMNKGGGGGKGGGYTPTIDWSQFQQPRQQAPTMQQSTYNPMMDMYGSSTQVMQPMAGYYNQYPIQGSNYQPYQPYQPPQEPAQAPQAPAPVQAQAPVQAPQQPVRGSNQNFAGRSFPREDATPYSTMPVGRPIYMSSIRPPELQQSYARPAELEQSYAKPQTQMPILDQANAGFGGYSSTPRFNFGNGINVRGSF